MKIKGRIGSLCIRIGIIIIVVCVLPIISVFTAIAIANLLNCEMNEGYANTCLLLGIDISELLYIMFVSGWFALATLPIIPLGISLLIIGIVIRLVQKYRKR